MLTLILTLTLNPYAQVSYVGLFGVRPFQTFGWVSWTAPAAADDDGNNIAVSSKTPAVPSVTWTVDN